MPSSRCAQERWIVAALCLFAALRVLFFSTLYPPINNLDEGAHLDLAIKYSNGQVPAAVGSFDPGVRAVIWLYFSPEYLNRRAELGGRWPAPRWSSPLARDGSIFRYMKGDFVSQRNYEDTQFPVYYALAGAWFRAGLALDLDRGTLLYWLRWLNVPILALTVFLAYAFARRFFGERPFVRLAAPAMVAFLPQSVFYGMNNDVVSALFAGAALLALLTLVTSTAPRSTLAHAGAGALLAIAMLTKVSNLVLLAPLAAASALRLRATPQSSRTIEARRLLVLTGTALAPVLGWLVRNRLVLGDWTGSAAKVAVLGWRAKPLAGLWPHPLFTPDGFVLRFMYPLWSSFWQGELMWERVPLSRPWAGAVYAVSSVLLLAGAAVLACRRDLLRDERVALGFAAGLCVLYVAMLGALSIRFDFGRCVNPSTANPFFVSGRLMLAVLVPFAAAYAATFDVLMRGEKLRRLRNLAFVILLGTMAWTDLAAAQQAFRSQYNWFHMT